MNKFLLIGVTTAALASARAQDAASTPGASPDMENLQQQWQALTETVKALQQQVKDQQAAIEKANGNAGPPPQNPEPSPIAAAANSPPPGPSAPARFQTEDTSVVASTAAPAASPGLGVNANETAVSGNFPTTDTSVVSSTPETISSTGAGASLTQPKSKLRKRSCKRRVCRSTCNLKRDNSLPHSAELTRPTRTLGISQTRRSCTAAYLGPTVCAGSARKFPGSCRCLGTRN